MKITGAFKQEAAFFAQLLEIDNFKLKIKKYKKNKYAGWLKRTDQGFVLRANDLRTIAHEMVHLKQYVKHELVDSGEIVFWKGEAMHMVTKTSEDSYWLSPWEMEARAMEDYLLYKWKER